VSDSIAVSNQSILVELNPVTINRLFLPPTHINSSKIVCGISKTSRHHHKLLFCVKGYDQDQQQHVIKSSYISRWSILTTSL